MEDSTLGLPSSVRKNPERLDGSGSVECIRHALTPFDARLECDLNVAFTVNDLTAN